MGGHRQCFLSGGVAAVPWVVRYRAGPSGGTMWRRGWFRSLHGPDHLSEQRACPCYRRGAPIDLRPSFRRAVWRQQRPFTHARDVSGMSLDPLVGLPASQVMAASQTRAATICKPSVEPTLVPTRHLPPSFRSSGPRTRMGVSGPELGRSGSAGRLLWFAAMRGPDPAFRLPRTCRAKTGGFAPELGKRS